jgi:hypothetical protein
VIVLLLVQVIKYRVLTISKMNASSVEFLEVMNETLEYRGLGGAPG